MQTTDIIPLQSKEVRVLSANTTVHQCRTAIIDSLYQAIVSNYIALSTFIVINIPLIGFAGLRCMYSEGHDN